MDEKSDGKAHVGDRPGDQPIYYKFRDIGIDLRRRLPWRSARLQIYALPVSRHPHFQFNDLCIELWRRPSYTSAQLSISRIENFSSSFNSTRILDYGESLVAGVPEAQA